jgi:hypothetical protein
MTSKNYVFNKHGTSCRQVQWLEYRAIDGPRCGDPAFEPLDLSQPLAR